MSTWKFAQESLHDHEGANTYAGLTAGNQPHAEADNLKSKRNVILTNKGWVRREHKYRSGSSGSVRQIDEILVAAHGADSRNHGYPREEDTTGPDIAQVYLANSTSENVTTIAALHGAGGSAHQICVVYNESIENRKSGVNAMITPANTVSGNNAVNAIATVLSTQANTVIKNANNTVVFSFTPTAGDAGTYKIGAQSITNAVSGDAGFQQNADDYSTIADVGAIVSANLVITGAVCNAFGTFTITAG